MAERFAGSQMDRGAQSRANWEQFRSRFAPTDMQNAPKHIRNPFWKALGSAFEANPHFTDERIERTANLYYVLTGENRVMADSTTNNYLLASAAIRAGETGTLPFWRFVCLPETTFSAEGNRFNGWKVNVNNKGYDTLSPALDRDQEILDQVQELGIDTRLHFVLDEWEVPLRRLRLTEGSFFSLPRSEQERAITELDGVRDTTTHWINDTVGGRIPYGIKFFSSMVGFRELLDLMDQQKAELDPHSGIILAERHFVQKLNNDTTLNEQKLAAMRRVAQYSVEGAVIPEAFPGGVFLASETPVQSVWGKVTHLNPNIPTLFYMTDADLHRDQQ